MKTYSHSNPRSRSWVAGLLMLTGAMSAAAADGADPQDWQLSGEVYLWGASIGGDTTTGGDLDIPFYKLLDNLDFAFMGVLDARKDKWALAADVIYLDVDEDNSGRIPLPISPLTDLLVPVDTNVRLKAWIVTPTVRYSLIEHDKGTLELLGGARYLWIDVTLTPKIGGLLNRQGEIDDSGSVWDGIVGVHGRVELADKWYFPYYLDVGAGDSDLTWQAFAGVGYRFNKVDGVLGYRYTYWDLNDNNALDDLSLGGPLLGVKFRF